MNLDQLPELIGRAAEARDRAYAPYSSHPVGAALLADNGEIFAGCNVESAALPCGTCAEQAAMAAMVLGGGRHILHLVVVGPGDAPCPPCGACRQRILEFSTPHTRVHLCADRGLLRTMDMDQLLPNAFGPQNLDTP